MAFISSWIESAAAVHVTDDRLLVLEGPERRAWLNALVTADLRSDRPSEVARYALLLTPAGQTISDFWIADRAEALVLAVPRSRAKRVETTLRRYVLGDAIDVRFDGALRVVTVQGPGAATLLANVDAQTVHPCPRLGPGGLDVWVPAADVDKVVARLAAAARAMAGGLMDAAAWAAAQVVLGLPRAGVDFDETTSVHEAGLTDRAVSFSKGCFVGQEATSRQRRGAGPSRRLVQLTFDGPADVQAGAMVREEDGGLAGAITSVAMTGPATTLALAYVRSTLAQPGTPLLVGSRRGVVRSVVGAKAQGG
jgi:folate-binding protein YgfZ